jgi:Rho GDP-dissociation inhibitor
MLGSYGPSPEGQPYTKVFDPEESPSGMLARSGKYEVTSRVLDDDGEVYAGMQTINPMMINFLMPTFHIEWKWYFQLAKEW